MRPGCTCPTLKPTCPVCVAYAAAHPARRGRQDRRRSEANTRRVARIRYRQYALLHGPLAWYCCGQFRAVDALPFVTPCCGRKIAKFDVLQQRPCARCEHPALDHVQGKCLSTLACRCEGLTLGTARPPRRRHLGRTTDVR